MNTAAQSKPLAPWTSHLPSNWGLCRLDAVADVLFSNVDKHTLEDEVPVRLCNYVDVYRNERITSRIDFMEASAEPHEITKFQVLRGDVLVTKDSETADDIAITALVAEDLPGVICGYHLALIRPRSRNISGAFLAWLHTSKPFRAQYEAKAVGVTRFGLSQHSFRELVIPLPPLPEQERIAAYLDASCAAIDATVAAKRRQLETLDALRKSTIEHAVTKGLEQSTILVDTKSQVVPKIPDGWRLQRLKCIANIRYGLGQPPEEQNDGVPMIRATNIDAGRIIEQNLLFVDRGQLPLDRNPYLKEDEILVVRSGAYTGDSAIVAPQYVGAVAGYDMVVNVTRAEPKFIAYGLLSGYVLEGQMLLLTLRAAQPHLNAEELGSIIFALPPTRTEQQAIVTFLDAKLAEIRSIEDIIGHQVETLLAYRKFLIHECVTGQRRITETDLNRVKGHG